MSELAVKVPPGWHIDPDTLKTLRTYRRLSRLFWGVLLWYNCGT